MLLASTHDLSRRLYTQRVSGCADDALFNPEEAFSRRCQKYHVTSNDGNSTQKKRTSKLRISVSNKYYLLVYHLKPKLTSNAVQIILAKTRMNEQLYS